MVIVQSLVQTKHILRVRSFGIFRNMNIFRNIPEYEYIPEYIPAILLLGAVAGIEIQVFRNENSSQTNAYLHYSNYSYSGLIPNECTLKEYLLL